MIETEHVRDYIKTRVEMLGSVLGRKTNEDLISIFQRNLDQFTIGILRKAFDKAESVLDRFPTPCKMVEIAAGFLPSTMWKYDYRDIKVTDPKTGVQVDAKRDPVSGEHLFRPQDCLEGRAFLDTFRLLAEDKHEARSDDARRRRIADRRNVEQPDGDRGKRNTSSSEDDEGPD